MAEMASNQKSKTRDRAMLARIACLYMVQGIPLGLGFEAIPTLLRDAGTSLSVLAWLPLVGVPWMFNLIWAPIVDNCWTARFGRRRTWIIPAQSLLIFSLLALAFVSFSVGNAALVLILAVLASAFSATQDIATDGLAAENLPVGAMAHVNAIQVGGLALGMLLGGAGVMIVTDQLGQFIALSALSAIVLLALLPTLFWSEPVSDHGPERKKARLVAFFSRKFAGQVLWLGLIATLSGTVLHGLWRLILVDMGWSPSQIGSYSVIGNTGFFLVGSVVAGPLIKVVGERKTGLIGMASAGLAALGWISIVQGFIQASPALICVLIAAGAFGISLSSVIVFAMVMRYAQVGTQQGTDFTVFQSSHTFSGVVASSVAISVSAQLGYVFGILIGFAICLLAILTLLLTDKNLFAHHAGGTPWQGQ